MWQQYDDMSGCCQRHIQRRAHATDQQHAGSDKLVNSTCKSNKSCHHRVNGMFTTVYYKLWMSLPCDHLSQQNYAVCPFYAGNSSVPSMWWSNSNMQLEDHIATKAEISLYLVISSLERQQGNAGNLQTQWGVDNLGTYSKITRWPTKTSFQAVIFDSFDIIFIT